MFEYMAKAKESEWLERMTQMCDKISPKSPVDRLEDSLDNK